MYQKVNEMRLSAWQPQVRARELKSANNIHGIKKVLLGLTLAAGDAGWLALSLWVALLLRKDLLPALVSDLDFIMPPGLEAKVWWFIILLLICLCYEGLYHKRLPFWQETKKAVGGITLTFILGLALITMAKAGEEVSRSILVIGYGMALFLLPIGRYLVKSLLFKMSLFQEGVLVVGDGPTGRQAAVALTRDRYLGYIIKGFIHIGPQMQFTSIMIQGRDYPVWPLLEDATSGWVRVGARQVVIAAPELAGDDLVYLVNRLQPFFKSLVVVPDLKGIPVMGAEAEYFFNERIMVFRTHNNLASPVNRWIKIGFDFIISILCMALVLPILGVIALLIKLDSPGPVIFFHRRMGRAGRDFNCYKFRTMRQDAEDVLEAILAGDSALREEWEQEFKLKDDPRITRIGRFLRRTSLDELPQFINIWKREMSLVGPRPIVQEEIPKFGDFYRDYCMVRPGLTGLWQVSGRNDIPYPQRAELESWYVHNWSVWLDITILFRTVLVVFQRNGAY